MGGEFVFTAKEAAIFFKYFLFLALQISFFFILTGWQLKRDFWKQKHNPVKSYRCTLGYFISEITLVASVWLCFRSGGHMVSTQSTWSTCESDQNCTFSHRSQCCRSYFLWKRYQICDLQKPFTTSFRECHVTLPLWAAWWGSPASCGWTLSWWHWRVCPALPPASRNNGQTEPCSFQSLSECSRPWHPQADDCLQAATRTQVGINLWALPLA